MKQKEKHNNNNNNNGSICVTASAQVCSEGWPGVAFTGASESSQCKIARHPSAAAAAAADNYLPTCSTSALCFVSALMNYHHYNYRYYLYIVIVIATIDTPSSLNNSLCRSSTPSRPARSLTNPTAAEPAN